MNKSVTELLQELTLEEKASLCSGQNYWQTQAIPRLDIPPVLVTDGPHGVRKQAGNFDRMEIKGIPSTCFPTASAIANSWNRELLHAVGVALGEESREEKVAVLLGPGINIKRSPLCGRNFEYFSEDPLLGGELAASWINGVQSQGVGTSLKHYAVNNQEYRRMIIDAVVDMRALREIYLTGFEIAVKKSQPTTIMSAYNRVNGVYCGEHQWLLDGVLRNEWQFKGLVVSDWGGCNDRVEGVRAGLDLEMPSSAGINDAKIVAAVREGSLDEAALDKVVARVLTLVEAGTKNLVQDFQYDRDAHHALARRAATESMVLLKNDANILPLRKTAKLAIIGEFAQKPRYQGSGSSQINPTRIDNACDTLSAMQIAFEYTQGYQRDSESPDEALIEAACTAARAAEVAVIFAGLPEIYESEGFDRQHMQMPAAHSVLIERVAAANPNVVVVLSSGAPVEIPWLLKAKAVIAGYLGGQASGSAIVDLLLGVINPSAKLAETWPLQLVDTPAHNYFPGGPRRVEYRESIYVGYRYYDTAQKAVAFPFGHGLSYTQFEYTHLTLSHTRFNADQSVQVSFTVKNIGALVGAEIVQLYVRDQQSTAYRPQQELKAFEKIRLQPGEEQTVQFTLDQRAFAFFDSGRDAWVVESGLFSIAIGASSRDIRLNGELSIDSDHAISANSDLRTHAPIYYGLSNTELRIDDAQFKAVFGSDLPKNVAEEKFHMNSLIGEMRTTFLGRQLHKSIAGAMQGMAERSNDKVLSKMMEGIAAEMPLRQLVAFSGGKLSFAMAEAMLTIMNGRTLAGMWQLIKAARQQK